MGTKYASVAVSGFNSSPPPDDGSTSASNQGTWAGVKTKLADPLNTAIAAINSELVTALDQSARLISSSDSAIATDHDKIIQISSTTSPALTLTLSDAATMAAGYVVTITNQSAVYAATVARATGGDTIDGAASNATLQVRSSVTYAVNSAGTGYVTISKSSLTGTPILMSPITTAIGSDVALNNAANYFTGPSIAQGTSGTWFVSGTVTLNDSAGNATFYAKLWDGTTVIDSAVQSSPGANNRMSMSLSGYIAAPAGELRISVRDVSSTSGSIVANESGNSKDSSITAIRIA